MTHLRIRLSRLVLLSSLVAMSSCDMPRFEGPQLQNPPRGFILSESRLPRPMFKDHDVVFATAWISTAQDLSIIHINGHRGELGVEQVMAAQDTARRYAEDPNVTFGQVEALTVDGRRAWGWEERLQTPARGLVWTAYRAAVPYDTITYSIEVYTGDPRFKPTSPDTLKAIIATFAVGRTTWNLPLIAILAGGFLFVIGSLRSRAKARAARLQSIHLVRFKKPQAGAAATADAPATGADAPSAATRATPARSTAGPPTPGAPSKIPPR